MNKEKYFSPAFIKEMMMNAHPSSSLKVNHTELFSIDNSASILVTLTSESSDEFIGHFGIHVNYTKEGSVHEQKMVMKVKPHGKAISDMLAGLSGMCSSDVQQEYDKVKDLTGFYDTHDKEIIIYTEKKSSMFPAIYGYYINEEANIYALLMEYFEDVELLNAVMDTEAWDHRKIQLGIEAMLHWHIEQAPNIDWYKSKYNDYRTEEQIEQLQATWKVLLNNAYERFPELYTKNLYSQLTNGIKEIKTLWQELEEIPKTIVHNDFNPRNAFFKVNNSERSICVYDWELATIHFPMYDLVEFLSFTSGSLSDEELVNVIFSYQNSIAQKIELYGDDAIFKASLLCSTYDFGLHRLGMYMMAHSVGPYPFIPHVVKNYERILNYANQNV